MYLLIPLLNMMSEDDPGRGFCYTAIHFYGESVLLAYLCGGRGGGVLQDLCIRHIRDRVVVRGMRER